MVKLLPVRAVVQRVTSANVVADGDPRGTMGLGLVVFWGAGCPSADDGALVSSAGVTPRGVSLEKWVAKLLALRVFVDDSGKMNKSLTDVQGSLYFVSQFTLFADLSSGNRPSFTNAASPAIAEEVYLRLCELLRGHLSDSRFFTGVFGAHMDVTLCNSGPVTFVWESLLLLP